MDTPPTIHTWKSSELPSAEDITLMNTLDVAALIDPGWLSPAVRSMLPVSYSVGLTDVDLGVLADALEEAGCTWSGLLGHLRLHGKNIIPGQICNAVCALVCVAVRQQGRDDAD